MPIQNYGNPITELERRISSANYQLLDIRKRTSIALTALDYRDTILEKKVQRIEDFLSADVTRFRTLRVSALAAVTGTIGGWSITTADIRNAAGTVKLRGAGNLAFGATPPTSATVGTGIFIDNTGVYGLNANTQEFYLRASDGKAVFGAGAVILDSSGITLTGTDALEVLQESITSPVTTTTGLRISQIVSGVGGGGLQGIRVDQVTNTSSGTTAALTPLSVAAVITLGDTVTDATGIRVSTSGAVSGESFAVRVVGVATGGTVNAAYGTAFPGSGANNYALYISSPAQSVHAGNLRIGSTTAPTVALDVTGSVNISSLTSGRVTFATTNGQLTDDADMTFAADTLTVTKIRSASSSGGIGYSTGAGGAVTQITSKSTSVTCNTMSGQITTHNAALGAGASVVFQLANSSIAATDVVIVHASNNAATDNVYQVVVIMQGAGFANLRLTNLSAGSLSEAVLINFLVIKGVAA